MTLKQYFIFCTMVCFVVCSHAHGLSVTAHVDKNQITEDDVVFLQVEVDETNAEIDTSSIKDFEVQSRGSSSFMRMINGNVEHKKTHQYMLIPIKHGRLTIPPVAARLKGKTTQSDPIIITVVKEKIDPAKTRDFFATAQLSQDKVYTGQQTVYTLKFYNSKKISGLGFEARPGFNALSAKSFNQEKSYTQRINGVVYRVTQVDYLIIPSKPGSFSIDPAVLIAQTVVQTQPNRGFDPFFTRQQTRPVRVRTGPASLDVKPLPPYQGKFSFSGLIGRFSIRADVDKTMVKAGESFTLSVEVSGSGNIMDAALPEMQIDPDRFKVYDDNPVESIQLTATGYEGRKVFKRAVVPVVSAKIELAPIRLVYFDPDLNAYHTVSTDPVRIDVAPSEKIHLTQTPQPSEVSNSVDKKEVALINRDILEIKEGLFVLEDHNPMHPLMFLVWLILPGVVFSGIKLFSTLMSKEISNRKIMLKKAAQSLKTARTKKDNKGADPQFYAHLYSAVVAAVLSTGDRQSETLTTGEAKAVLKGKIDESKIDGVVSLLSRLEAVRFGNTIPDEKQKAVLLKQVSNLFKQLSMIILVCVVIGFSPAKEGQAQPSKDYFNALKSYQEGEYEQAAHQFERIANVPVNNPYLYFNIGNAYLKAGDIGRAILWYERSKKLNPNDPDLKFNLDFANSQVKDKKEDKVDMVKILFFWDGRIQIKTLQMISIVFSVVFFAWAAIQLLRKKRILTGTGTLILSVFLIVLFMTLVSMVNQIQTKEAVIVEKEVIVRSGTLDNATDLFTLHQGTIIRVQDQKNGFIKIVFSKDKVGWIARSQAELI